MTDPLCSTGPGRRSKMMKSSMPAWCKQWAVIKPLSPEPAIITRMVEGIGVCACKGLRANRKIRLEWDCGGEMHNYVNVAAPPGRTEIRRGCI